MLLHALREEVGARLDGVAQDHEGRIRALERGRWPLPSVAVLVAGASLAAQIFGWGG